MTLLRKRDPDDPTDKNLVDISSSYGRFSYRRKIFAERREAPAERRGYNPKEVRWMKNKFRLERNMKKGYEYLGLARQARKKAFYQVAKEEKGQAKDIEQKNRKSAVVNIDWKPRKKRIENYLASIRMSRRAKVNAAFIYMLKYPYDNYALQNPYGTTEKGSSELVSMPVIEDVRMNWSENPFLFLKKLHPIFNLSRTRQLSP